MEGIGIYTYEIVRRIVENNPQDEFIFLFDRPYDSSFIFAENVKGIVVSPPARHPILWKIWFDWRLPSILKKEKIEVFFSPDGYLSLKSRVPTVMTLHDLAYLHYPDQVPNTVYRYYKKYTPYFLQQAKNIVTVSRYGKKDVLKHFTNLDENKVHAIRNGCRSSFESFDESQINTIRNKHNNGRPYFLFVGAIHPRKNVIGLIKAFDQFAKENEEIDLLVLGRMAWQNKKLEKVLAQLKHKQRIKFLGFVPDETLNKLMNACFAFLYPSFFEGFGLPILEAFHAEVPVITSNVSSMPEVAGDAALLVNPDDVNEICQAMKSLAGSPELVDRLIEKGRQQRTKFSWDTAAKEIYKIISNSRL